MDLIQVNNGKLVKMGRSKRLMAIHEDANGYYGLIISPKGVAR
jgi:hypothetical protein